jgi:hypothetical protein
MPRELSFLGARDMAASPLDVHTYNKFYTFQVDRDVSKRNEGI